MKTFEKSSFPRREPSTSPGFFSSCRPLINVVLWNYHFYEGAFSLKRKLLSLLLSFSLCLSFVPVALAAEDVYEESEDYTLEQYLEGRPCSVALRWKPLSPEEDTRDYELWLLYHNRKPKRLLLPSTVISERDPSLAPTDRAPNSLSLRDNYFTLTYVYRFEERLTSGDNVLHEAGVYTYTVDLATGELDVSFTETDFTDVSPDDWFAPYVETCVNAGLMKGVGDGKFEPHRKLSDKESTVMALRLTAYEAYFPSLPTDWTWAVITTQDGTALRADCAAEGGWDYNLVWSWRTIGGTETIAWKLATQSEKDWGRSVDCQPGGIDIVGTGFSGYIYLYEDHTGLYLYFKPADSVSGLCADALHYLRQSGSWDSWYREAAYYALGSYQGRLLTDQGQATRDSFAWKIAEVTSYLPTINMVHALPDTNAEYVLSLYKKGILAGVDENLTFRPDGDLTRAEAAAMLARVADPALRLQFAPPEAAPYTLTELDVGRTGFWGDSVWGEDYLLLSLPGETEPDHQRYSFLTKDGRTIDLGTDQPWDMGKDLVVLRRSAVDQYGIMDLQTGNMILPFGYWGWPGYSSCRFLQDGEHFVTGDPENYAHDIVWDREGNRVWDGMSRMDWWSRFHDGLLAQKWDGLWGFVDVDNHMVIAPQWDSYSEFRDGYAPVSISAADGEYTRWGVIDTQGELVVPMEYHFLVNCGQGMFFFQMYTPDGRVAKKGMVRAGDGAVFSGDFASDRLDFRNGYARYNGFYYEPQLYVDMDMVPVSPYFDWAGPIGADGSGFVGQDGKIYRIQF